MTPQANSRAIVSLVLGIAGIVFVPVLLSIPALVVGYRARREIDASNGMQTGRGLAIAGIVCGWIGVAFGLLLVAGIVLFGVLAL